MKNAVFAVGESVQCSICIFDIVDNEVTTKLLCNHIFHRACLAPWIKKNSTCPQCRCFVGNIKELIRAVVKNEFSWVKILLDAGAHPDAVFILPKGYSPIFYAIKNKSYEVVDVLLAAGASVNTITDDLNTPLLWAIKKKVGVKIITKLIQSGADITYLDSFFRTPLYYAIKNKQVKIVKQLLSGMKKEFFLQYHDHALHWAAKSNSFSILKLLIDFGAQCESVDEYGCTPLSYAVKNKNIEMVAYLLDTGFGVDPKPGKQSENYSLFLAVKNNSKKILKLLLSVGKQPNVLDRYGLSPLNYAYLLEQEKMVVMLEATGAF